LCHKVEADYGGHSGADENFHGVIFSWHWFAAKTTPGDRKSQLNYPHSFHLRVRVRFGGGWIVQASASLPDF
jgi:hypothetical protein